MLIEFDEFGGVSGRPCSLAEMAIPVLDLSRNRYTTSRMRGHRCATNSLKKLELHKEGSIKENIEITFKACFGLLKGFCHKGKWIKICT